MNFQEIPGLTDHSVPRRLGPKRASKIRKLFNLSKEDDVRQYVIKRPLTGKEGKKPKYKAPKIQRLITPTVLQVRDSDDLKANVFSIFSLSQAVVWLIKLGY